MPGPDMVLTINSFISILQTINVLWERGKRGKSLEFWLKIPAAVSRALMIHGRPLSCLKVNSLLMVCPGSALPRHRVQKLFVRGEGPGVGARQLGRQLQWPVALLSPELIRSDRTQARHPGHCQQQDQSKLGTWQDTFVTKMLHHWAPAADANCPLCIE